MRNLIPNIIKRQKCVKSYKRQQTMETINKKTTDAVQIITHDIFICIYIYMCQLPRKKYIYIYIYIYVLVSDKKIYIYIYFVLLSCFPARNLILFQFCRISIAPMTTLFKPGRLLFLCHPKEHTSDRNMLLSNCS